MRMGLGEAPKAFVVKKPGHQVCVGLFWIVLYRTLSLIISNINIVLSFSLYHIKNYIQGFWMVYVISYLEFDL